MTDPARALRPDRPRIAESLAALTQGIKPSAITAHLARGATCRLTAETLDWHEHGELQASWVLATTDPRAAWEILATQSALPYAALDAPLRTFRGLGPCSCGAAFAPDDERGGEVAARILAAGEFPYGRAGELCGPCRGIETDGHGTPRSLADAVALAACWPSILAAEELARVWLARMARFGAPQPERVVWRTVERAAWRPSWLHRSPARWVCAARDEASYDAWREVGGDMRSWAGLPDCEVFAGWFAEHAAAWMADPRTAVTPNPWAALVSMVETGMAVDSVTAHALVMACPAL